jgi:PAS domain S-box-containing protein
MDSNTQDSPAGTENTVPEQYAENLGREISILERRALLAEQRVEALKTALESAEAGYWEWDIGQNTIHIDRLWAAITGHTPDEFDSLTIDLWKEQCHPEDLSLINRLLDEHLAGETESFELDIRVRHKSGDWVRVVDRGKISNRDRNGKPLCLAGSRQTTRKQEGQSESQEKNIRKELHDLIESIPGVIYDIDETGKTSIRSRPPVFLKTLVSDRYGTTLFDTLSMIYHDDRQMVTEAYSKLRAKQLSMTLVYRVVTPEGELRWVEDHKRSCFSDKGVFTGIHGILCDISNRITGQEETRRVESQLRKSQRLETIGTLAGGIAHDFNNILTPILGYAEMGLSSIDEDDPMYEYFTEIMQAAERARKLVSQILTFSRAEDGKLVPVKVQNIIAEAIQLLRPSLPSSISIEEHINDSCPEILADPAQIHQVVVNLCTNAIHAMEQTGGVLRIALREPLPGSGIPSVPSSLTDRNSIELTVSDTGTGMDELTLERIFEPFFTTKSIEKGTGLGLSVVHGIIMGINGQLSVESAPGKGSTFHVWLPVIEQKVVSAPEPKPLQEHHSCNVLFIDDEAAAVQMVSIMMTKLGFNIRAEKSPVEALNLFRENPDQFDLVITDLTMPEMTGIQLAGELHKIAPSIPVILMTGYGKIIDHDTPLSYYGINRLLKKPVKLAQLAAAVNEVLSSTNSSKSI